MNKLIFENDICESISALYKKVESNISDDVQELVKKDIEIIVNKMRVFTQANTVNI